MNNPYESSDAAAEESPRRENSTLFWSLLVVGALAIALGLYSVAIRYSAGAMIMYDVHPELRDLTKEQWRAVNTGVQAVVIQIAVPLRLGAAALWAAAISAKR